MNGESAQLPESHRSVKGAELCPKCLGLVFCEEGVCKQCGERVFPNPNLPPPSAEFEEASDRKCWIASLVCFAVPGGLKFYTIGENWIRGAASSWTDWILLVAYALGLGAGLCALRSRSKPSGDQ